ncbi:sel1 repeat family protein [bacterium]|nr:MAG: sel1 repeat family protein [bacterium]
MDLAWVLYHESLDNIGEAGHPVNYALAFSLNAKAATLGLPDAILAMGWFYFNGFGVRQNLREATHWYRRSARAGDPRAMFSLGQIACDEGQFETARYWFELANKHGHIRSLYWLGKLYWRGKGVSQDRAQAMRLFERAAHRNDPEAKRLMIFMNRRKYLPNSKKYSDKR